MANAMQLGQGANLLFGYRPVWDPSSANTYPFFAPRVPPVNTITPSYVPSSNPSWIASPTITVHTSATSLLSAIYDYRAVSMASDPSPVQIPPGPLALDDADSKTAFAAVGSFLGLDLSGGQSYMLVTLQRISATATHPFASDVSAAARTTYLTDEAAAAIAALTPAQAPQTGSALYDSKLTQADALKYIDTQNQIGTYFVSEIVVGDLVLQVFAYAADRFRTIQQSFDAQATVQPDGTRAVTGAAALSFAYYTSQADGRYGFVSSYGSLVCLSRDPALESAVQAGSWANNYVPTGTPSIFAATSMPSLLTPLQLQVPIGLTLTPLASLISDQLVAGPWYRLVAGGLQQKYGDDVQIPLQREIDYDWATLFPDAAGSWQLDIVTPTVDIYQERVDLAQVNLQGGLIVSENFQMNSFTSFSQVLEASQQQQGTIPLPSDAITLIAQIIDTTGAAHAPVLSMSTKALQNIGIYCQEMYGSLILQDDAGNRKVALDGFLFTTLAIDPTSGRYKVGLSRVFTDPPDATTIAAVKQSIEFSVVAGESLLQAQGTSADTVRALEKSYLLWLASIIPADTQDADLASNRARALYLANDIATFSSTEVYVPYLSYDAYTKYVSDMVGLAQTINQTIGNYQIQITDTVNAYKTLDSIANLNDNIKAIGGVLTQYFAALSANRASMDGYYGSVLAQLENQLQATLTDITSLQGKLADQQKIISNTGTPTGIIQQFQQDYADYSKDLIAQCVISGVEGLFSLGLSMAAIPGEAEGGVLKALKAIKDTYDKLQAVMKVLSQLSAIQSAVGKVTDINKLSASIATLGAGGDLEMPSDVDLKLMAQNVQAALANVPSTGGLNQDKANLIAAVNSLVIVGSALVDSQTKASSLLVQMANLNRQKAINSDQQARMNALTNALHLRDVNTPPDINSINLIGTTGQLQYQLRQVLVTLSQTLQLQNGALQFEYFGTPLPITSFTLLNLMTVISSQDQAINNALQKLNPQPQQVPNPITVKIPNVLASKVSGGQVFQVSIGLDRSEFSNYDMVRIDRVVPNISGIKSTTSGNYEIHLNTQAKPFYDRDYDRTAWTYASDRRQFGPYVYNAQTGAAQFGTGTGTFADKVTHLTPFSDWEISLPSNVQNNQGIVFNGLFVDLELDFYVTAHYDDPVRFSAANLRQTLALQRAPVARGVPFQNVELFAAPAAAPAAATATVGSGPSLANLEAQMYQNQAVMQKWDAVFSVLVGPVNAFLYQQFQAYIAKLDPKNADNLMQVTAYYCDGVSQFRGVWFTNVTKMLFKLSNPLLEFVPGNDSVTVRQNILSGTINTGTLEVTQTGFDPGKCQLVDAPVNFTAVGNGTLTLSVNGVFENNMQVMLSSTGTLPAPLQPNTDYWIVNWASSSTSTTLQLSTTAGGTPIALSSTGSGTQTIFPDIEWGTPMTVDVSKNPYVIGNVSLTRVSGIVEPPSGQGSASETHTVVLDFPSGAFQLNKFAVNPPNFDPDHHATAISAALANFYATNEIQYQVQTINYTNLSQDAALQPTKFLFNAQNTNAGNNILQIFIATTGAVQQATTLNLNEPIAYDPSNPVPGQSNFMVSLMVSTKLMFQHIFVDSFNQGGTNIQVAAIDPGNDFTAWSAQITQGTVTGNVPFQDSYEIDNTETQFRISAANNNLTWSLQGLTFSHSPDAGIALNYSNGTASPPSGGTTIGFQYRQWYSGQYSSGWGSWQDASAVAYINMNGNYPLQVTGSGSQQKVTFQNLDPTIDFQKASDLVPQSGCQCNDNDIKIALLSSLADNVPGTLKTYLEQITFQPISVFALENLLFPADQLITMQQAVVPGDLLVVGTFLAQVRQKNPTYDVTISAASGAKGTFGGANFQNGQGTGSATKTGVLGQFQFTYGPIDSTYGGMVNYSIDIEAGTVSPANLMVVVDQPDPQNSPKTVILLPPGYGPITP